MLLKNVGIQNRDGLLTVIFTIVAIAANFLFQLMVANSLGPREFGLLSVILISITIGVVATTGVQVTAAKGVVRNLDRSSPVRIMDPLTVSTLVLSGVIALAIVLFSAPLAELFQAPVSVVWIIAGMLPILGLFAVTNGRLQGRGLIVAISGISAALSLLKLIGGAGSIYFKLGVPGLAIVLASTTAVVTLIALLLTRRFGIVTERVWQRSSGNATLMQVAFWLLLSSAVLIGRIKFTETAAGQFAVADLLSKSVLLFPTLILIVLLPRYVRALQLKESAFEMTVRAIGVTLVLLFPGVGIMVIAGDWIVNTLFGSNYILAPGLVGILSVLMVPFGLAGILIQFHLANETSMSGVFLLVVVVVTSIMLWLTSEQIYLYSAVFGLGGLCALLLLIPVRIYRRGWNRISMSLKGVLT